MDKRNSDIAERVLAFVSDEVPPPRPNNISIDTDLRTDLRMLWEDAEAMLSKFFVTFNVDQGDFDFSRYFPNEGGLLLNLAARLSGKRRLGMQPEKLTVGMLARAAEAGIWHAQEIGPT
jgi:hypothetical protein